MNLAYMAELAVVVNLAYLELKSLRYVADARIAIKDEVAQGLEFKPVNGNGHESSQLFAELILQVANLFSDTCEKRRSAWYVREAEKENYFSFVSDWCYPIFMKKADRKISTLLLMVACMIIVAMTLLSRVASEEFNASWPGCFIWWLFFGLLSLAMLMPVVFVAAGRRIKNCLALITLNLKERKADYASETLNQALSQSTFG
jgi:hypothetical protein